MYLLTPWMREMVGTPSLSTTVFSLSPSEIPKIGGQRDNLSFE